MPVFKPDPVQEGAVAPAPSAAVLAGRWLAILALSALLGGGMEAAGLPAALLLGPMIAAGAMAVSGRGVPLPRAAHFSALGVVGCMVGAATPPTVLGDILAHWPVFLAGVGSVVALAGGLGWLLARAQVLPGTTAVWGAWPGAASAMVILSDAHGADMRLVAVMQYLRVGLVAASAALIARFWVGVPEGAEAPAVDWVPPLDPGGLAVTAAVVGASLLIGRIVRMPSALFLAPMAIAIALHGADLPTPALPPWLLAAAYAVAGWGIGLRFTRPILAHAARALPRLLLGIVALIALCFGLGAALAWATGEDLLTAVLATSPGGMDSVAIVAASSDVDMPFVMAMQTARFLAVLFLGPWLARRIAALVAPA
ncbi:AbrB family transcriptional regulator [Albimonas sp. CAU 1670]|uniref:AbrB family transcriptional regulator n=1 Tax=Albimonas sp. CAU 1670 TaxID=3032599 RepID=UPI0023DC97F7|nr:AbrB family transcriptional regulator [Albimonas sp. CAU 1670]MDF2233541.1 AbrB family transcriptional regulator [Albimonas sp. CAU 1670]